MVPKQPFMVFLPVQIHRDLKMRSAETQIPMTQIILRALEKVGITGKSVPTVKAS
jgi:hypothetical protein